jgi:uncharacterized RDD family membrane protein YckC
MDEPDGPMTGTTESPEPPPTAATVAAGAGLIVGSGVWGVIRWLVASVSRFLMLGGCLVAAVAGAVLMGIALFVLAIHGSL